MFKQVYAALYHAFMPSLYAILYASVYTRFMPRVHRLALYQVDLQIVRICNINWHLQNHHNISIQKNCGSPLRVWNFGSRAPQPAACALPTGCPADWLPCRLAACRLAALPTGCLPTGCLADWLPCRLAACRLAACRLAACQLAACRMAAFRHDNSLDETSVR